MALPGLFGLSRPSPQSTKTYLTLSDAELLFQEFNAFYTKHFNASYYPHSLEHYPTDESFKAAQKDYAQSEFFASLSESTQKALNRPLFPTWLLNQNLEAYQLKEECVLICRSEKDFLQQTWFSGNYLFVTKDPWQNSQFYQIVDFKPQLIPIKDMKKFAPHLFRLMEANRGQTTLTKDQIQTLAQVSGTQIPNNYFERDHRFSAFDCNHFSEVLCAWLTAKKIEKNIENLNFQLVMSTKILPNLLFNGEQSLGRHEFVLISIHPKANHPDFFNQNIIRQGYHLQGFEFRPKMTTSQDSLTFAWDPFNPGGADYQSKAPLRWFGLDNLPHHVHCWGAKKMVPTTTPTYAITNPDAQIAFMQSADLMAEFKKSRLRARL